MCCYTRDICASKFCNYMQKGKGYAKSGPNKGRRIYAKYCSNCCGKKYENKLKYKSHKKEFCEVCGFEPLHSCQLDVDHIDGNKKNNNCSNFQTLCANCHRLKTWCEKDYLTSP